MILEYTILGVYTLALVLILMYALAQLNLLLNYLSSKKKEENVKGEGEDNKDRREEEERREVAEQSEVAASPL